MKDKPFEGYDIYVDFGCGDKFKVELGEIDPDKKRLIFKGCQGQMRWVKTDALHPVGTK